MRLLGAARSAGVPAQPPGGGGREAHGRRVQREHAAQRMVDQERAHHYLRRGRGAGRDHPGPHQAPSGGARPDADLAGGTDRCRGGNGHSSAEAERLSPVVASSSRTPFSSSPALRPAAWEGRRNRLGVLSASLHFLLDILLALAKSASRSTSLSAPRPRSGSRSDRSTSGSSLTPRDAARSASALSATSSRSRERALALPCSRASMASRREAIRNMLSPRCHCSPFGPENQAGSPLRCIAAAAS